MTQSPDRNGDRSISVVGTVTSSALITGDYNVVHQHVPRLLVPIPVPAPPLPKYFVPRPEITHDLKSRLWGEKTTEVALVASAIHGLGGIGKSTLVAALAHDPEVQEHFPDGVFWATLGQQPDLLALLSSWVHALGDRDFRPTTAEAASDYLRGLLRDKAALLVVDDAWDPADTTPFLIGGTKCRVLITTRDGLIAKVVGADRYDLDVMTPEQALSLLIGRLGRDLADDEQTQALDLAKIVGYLPLALELAAAQATEGVSWVDLLTDLKAEIARLESLSLLGADEFKEDQDRKRHSLLASFHLSLCRLKPEKHKRFAWLGVLPEDAILSPAMMTVLWETELRPAQETLGYLREKALLLPAVSLADGTRTYRLHDLLHDLARRVLTAPRDPAQVGELPGLGIPLPAAHATFLNRYRSQTQSDLWHTLPDDGYIYTYLAWHLEQSGQGDGLYALLSEETPERRNGWYQARERTGQTAGYLADVARAWRLAEEQCAHSPSLAVIERFFRCAFLMASLNSLAKNVPPDLLAALVEKGVWMPAQGLAYARQIPTSEQRARTLRIVAPHLPAPLRIEAVREAVVAMSEVEEDDDQTTAAEKAYKRAEELLALAPYLSAPLQQEARTLVTLALTLGPAIARAEALTGLLPYLPTPLKEDALQEALVALRAAGNETEWSAALPRLLSGLANHGYPSEALAIAHTIQSHSDRIVVLMQIVPYLSSPLREQTLQEALAIAPAIQLSSIRVDMLMQIVPHLPAPLREQALQEALAIAPALESASSRLAALIQISPYLPASAQAEPLRSVLMTARTIRANLTLAAMLPQLADLGYCSEALAIGRGIPLSRDRAQTLVRLVPHLPTSLQEEAIRELSLTMRNLSSREDRARVLVMIVSHLPAPVKEENLRAALAAVQAVEQTGTRAQLLAHLAPHLPEPLLQEALAVVRGINLGTDRVEVLAHLAPHLPAFLLQEALILVRAIGDEEQRLEALLSLARRLPPLEKLWAALGWGIQDELQRMAMRLVRGTWTTISNTIYSIARLLLIGAGVLGVIVGGLALVVAFPLITSVLVSLFGLLLRALGFHSWVLDRWVEARAYWRTAKVAGQNLLKPLQRETPALDRGRTHAGELAELLIDSSKSRSFITLPAIWSELHRTLAYRTRQDLLLDMYVLSHMLVALGGKQALKAIAGIIQDVERWWP